MRQTTSDFPPIDAAYTDEFGRVDPEVHNVAREIWSPAKFFALRFLRDSHKGLDLLLKSVARVSRIRENTQIDNLRAYLYLTYKRLILAEIEKENGHQRLLSERFAAEVSNRETEEELNKKILINELRLRMDDWTRDVFDLLSLGYTYENLVPRYGKAANVIRSKYSKKIAGLARRINSEIEKLDETAKS